MGSPFSFASDEPRLWLLSFGETKESNPARQARKPAVQQRKRGFTLIELLVVMSIIAVLVTIAVPRYFTSVDRSKEAVLRSNLATVREAIDKYYGDRGKYPENLQELVAKRYLRTLPRDPVTDSTTTWVIVPPPETAKGNVYDIKSGAPGRARDGTEYRSW